MKQVTQAEVQSTSFYENMSGDWPRRYATLKWIHPRDTYRLLNVSFQLQFSTVKDITTDWQRQHQIAYQILGYDQWLKTRSIHERISLRGCVL